ncbi:MAG TPA: C4-type zinc ribbon domain-containing protein [Sphaerochaeta sp.]|nr:C4-type zinc ribbon domain-containing protein [Sphaerochaeta sp.]
MMNEAAVFSRLNQLQNDLSIRFALEEEIARLPRDLKVKQELLDTINLDYIEEHSRSETAKVELKNLGYQYEDAVQARDKSERNMELITTQREFEALEKEIKDAAAKEQSLLKQLHVKEKQVQEFEIRLTEKEELMALQKSEVDAEASKIDALLAEKKQELAEVSARCESYIDEEITHDLYKKFSNIVKNKKGKGIVPVHGLVCQGCHVILPVQFVNSVRDGKDVEFCPYCSRILYWEDVDGAEDKFIAGRVDPDADLGDFVQEGEFDDVL